MHYNNTFSPTEPYPLWYDEDRIEFTVQADFNIAGKMVGKFGECKYLLFHLETDFMSRTSTHWQRYTPRYYFPGS